MDNAFYVLHVMEKNEKPRFPLRFIFHVMCRRCDLPGIIYFSSKYLNPTSNEKQARKMDKVNFTS